MMYVKFPINIINVWKLWPKYTQSDTEAQQYRDIIMSILGWDDYADVGTPDSTTTTWYNWLDHLYSYTYRRTSNLPYTMLV